MLSQLKIENFALIQNLSIDFCAHLNVLTGETGAGKSILINAVRFVLGERLDPAKRFLGEKKSVVEAVFEVDVEKYKKRDGVWNEFFEDAEEDLVVLRRELLSSGKARASVNGRTVTASTLRQLSSQLIDIHGQHDHQLLFNPKTHLNILDRYGKLEGALRDYLKFFEEYQDLCKRRDELKALEAGRERELDLLKYQIDEIESAGLSPDEEEELQLERIRLANAEKLFELSQATLAALDEDDYSVSSKLGDAYRGMTGLSRLDESLSSTQSSFEDAQLAIEEVIRSVRDYQESLSFDPDRLEEIEKRIDLITLLKKKYGASVSEVLEFYDSARIQYDKLINSSLYEDEVAKKIKALMPKLQNVASEIRKKRKKAASEIKKAIETELRDLELKHAKFEVNFEEEDFGANGRDKVKFLISLNAGQPLMDLAKIISGGEASRVMLALKKGLVQVDPIGTLIFDEIDSNIGGRLGTVVGTKLKEIARGHQVLLITHLPQIASFADRHIKVSKKTLNEETHTEYRVLQGEDQVLELAQMMSGAHETEISKKHAKEMLKQVKALV